MGKTNSPKKTSAVPLWKIAGISLLAVSLVMNVFLLWSYIEVQDELESANQVIELFEREPGQAPPRDADRRLDVEEQPGSSGVTPEAQ